MIFKFDLEFPFWIFRETKRDQNIKMMIDVFGRVKHNQVKLNIKIPNKHQILSIIDQTIKFKLAS